MLTHPLTSVCRSVQAGWANVSAGPISRGVALARLIRLRYANAVCSRGSAVLVDPLSLCAVRWERSQGRIVRQKNRAMAPEAVRDQWEQICDFTDATKPSTVQGQDAPASIALHLLNTRGNVSARVVPRGGKALTRVTSF